MPRVYRFPRDNKKIGEAFASYIEAWKPRLFLNEWEITLHITAGADAAETTFHNGQNGPGATTEITPHYLRALICLNLPNDAEWSDEELEMTAIHELLHIILQRVTTFADGHKEGTVLCKQYHIAEEEVCTRLERIIYSASLAVANIKAVAKARAGAAAKSKRESRRPARAAGQRRSGGS